MPKLITNILMVATLLWLGLITIMLWRLPQEQLGLIDTQRLVAHQAQQLGASQSQLSPQQMQLLADKIKATVASYALQHKLILIAKNAIWGGVLIDYTPQVIAALAGAHD